MSCEHQWKAAISWVQSNHTLIGYISAPYRKHMSSDARDIEQEAILAAFCTLSVIAKKKASSHKFGAYFRVQFRTRCIKMATGGMGNDFNNIDQIASSPYEQKYEVLDHETIEQALQRMSNRQRQISRWILAQPTPVNTAIVAKEFGICGRTVRAIVCNAIKRVEKRHHGNTQIRKNISLTT